MRALIFLLVGALTGGTGLLLDATDAVGQEEDSAPSAVRAEESEKVLRSFFLQTVAFAEIEDMLEAVRSPSGHLHFIESRNMVLIYDNPAVVRHMELLLQRIDRAPVNIRISVAFDESFEAGESGIGLTQGGVVVTRERGGGTRVEGTGTLAATDRTRRGRSETTQFLMVRDDRPARIWAGKTVAQPVWTFEYGLRRGWWQQETVYQNIGASLWIHPRRIGEDRIRVEVYPVLTLEGRTPRTIEARELSTEIVVADGGTIELGGLDEEKREAYRQLFGVGQVFDGRRLTIRLQAEIVR